MVLLQAHILEECGALAAERWVWGAPGPMHRVCMRLLLVMAEDGILM